LESNVHLLIFHLSNTISSIWIDKYYNILALFITRAERKFKDEHYLLLSK